MWRTLGGLVVAAALLCAGPVSAAVEGYLEIDGMPGASTDRAATIAFTDLTYGGGRAFRWPMLGGGHSLQVVRPADQASLALWKAAQSGERFARALVYVRSGDGAEAAYRASVVVISNFQTDHLGRDGRPVDRFTLIFTDISPAGASAR